MPSKPLVRGESPTASRPSTPPASVTPSGQYATVRGVEGTLVPVPPAQRNCSGARHASEMRQ